MKVMTHMHDGTAAIVGGGPAGLMAAETLARANIAVTVYERMPSLGRKFLMAGRGGLNLTHSEDMTRFTSRYGEAEPHLRRVIDAFPPERLRAWSAELGQPTFAGTSGRVFPEAMKASPLLRAWLRRLDAIGVQGRAAASLDRLGRRRRADVRHAGRRCSCDAGRDGAGARRRKLAAARLGWRLCGYSGARRHRGRAAAGRRIADFASRGPIIFRARFEGQPLKPVALSFGGQRVRGEAVITRDGLEGGAVYALSPLLREAIDASGAAELIVDLLPDMDGRGGDARLERAARQAVALERAAQDFIAVACCDRTGAGGDQGKLGALAPDAMAAFLKAVPVTLTGVAPIERAISTAGGVTFDAIDESFMLKQKPGVFVAGEMLDWEAPTGGYLLQACFATGVAAGEGAARYLAARRKRRSTA